MKFLVVGCGSIGRRHLRNLAQLKAGTISAWDPQLKDSAELVRDCGAVIYKTLQQALQAKPDVVFVCTPTHLHTPVAGEALQAGADLFVEKPIATTLNEADILLKKAEALGKTVSVACNMRFHPGVACIKKDLEKRTLKGPLLFRAHFHHYLPNWRPGTDYHHSYSAGQITGGGVFLEGVHEIDYLQWIAGGVCETGALGGHFSDLEIETEDTGLLLLRFQNGDAAEITLDYRRPLKSRGCEVIGSNGILRWVSEGKNPEKVLVERYTVASNVWETLYKNDAYDANEMYLEQMKNLLDLLAGKKVALQNGIEARETLRIALSAKAAIGYPILETELPSRGEPAARSLVRSQELKERAQQVIPSCSQTFSKGPKQFVQGVSPVFLQRGQGSHVWDVDGNEYIDYPMALGPILLGHNYPAVTKAVMHQLQEGTIFSLPHPLEVAVAELLTEVIPCAEMVRFAKNGSDATAGAVRVARAFTERDVIACCGYHGWQDWYVGSTTRNRGVPKAVRDLTIPFEYNKIETLERIFSEHPNQVAAVILEPIGVLEPKDDFLAKTAALARRNGAVVIFDEIVTGFRLNIGGAQAHFGVTPDLACFGKSMANGYPISAVVGRQDIMGLFDEVFFSFTFGGETLSLAAAQATIREIREKEVIPYLWRQGNKLKKRYNVLSREFGLERHTECVGLPPRTIIRFQDAEGKESMVYKSLFQQECIQRGILFTGNQNICYSHDDADIERTLRVYRETMEILAEAVRRGDAEKRLAGRAVEPVFRKA